MTKKFLEKIKNEYAILNNQWLCMSKEELIIDAHFIATCKDIVDYFLTTKNDIPQQVIEDGLEYEDNYVESLANTMTDTDYDTRYHTEIEEFLKFDYQNYR